MSEQMILWKRWWADTTDLAGRVGYHSRPEWETPAAPYGWAWFSFFLTAARGGNRAAKAINSERGSQEGLDRLQASSNGGRRSGSHSWAAARCYLLIGLAPAARRRGKRPKRAGADLPVSVGP